MNLTTDNSQTAGILNQEVSAPGGSQWQSLTLNINQIFDAAWIGICDSTNTTGTPPICTGPWTTLDKNNWGLPSGTALPVLTAPNPQNYDWRTATNTGNCGTPSYTVLDQGTCGSCYIFAGIVSMYQRQCKNTANPISMFSVQAVMTCSKATPQAFNCNGGDPGIVVDWLGQNNSFVTNTCCAPYAQTNGGNVVGVCPTTSCQPPMDSTRDPSATGVVNPNPASGTQFLGCPTPPTTGALSGAAIQLAANIPFNAQSVGNLYGDNRTQKMQAIMAEISTNGPVGCMYNVPDSFGDFFSNPANAQKVFDPSAQKAYLATHTADNAGGHASVIVGQGLANNSNTDGYTYYWLVQNSWGGGWADGGFCKIAAGINFLTIENGVNGVRLTQPPRHLSGPTDLTPAQDSDLGETAITSSNLIPGAPQNCDPQSESVVAAVAWVTAKYSWGSPTLINATCVTANGSTFNLDLFNCGSNPICSLTVSLSSSNAYSVVGAVNQYTKAAAFDWFVAGWAIALGITLFIFIITTIVLAVQNCNLRKKIHGDEESVEN